MKVRIDQLKKTYIAIQLMITETTDTSKMRGKQVGQTDRMTLQSDA